MNKPVWKCKNCEYGPCYIQCKNERDDGSVFGDGGPMPPLICPWFSEGEPDFQFNAPEVQYNLRWGEELYEWLCGEGYDNAPEEIRDGLAVELDSRIDGYRAMQIIGLLRRYEEDRDSGWVDREEFSKELKKISREELLNAVFPEAFKMGVIYSEMIRQRKVKNEKAN